MRYKETTWSFYYQNLTMERIAETRRAFQTLPKGVINGYVFMCACIFALAGVSKGFDEGNYKLATGTYSTKYMEN